MKEKLNTITDAFIVFNNKEARDQLLEKNDKFKIIGQKLHSAKEPQNIKWDNMHFDNKRRKWRRKIAIAVLVVILLVVTIALIYVN